MPRLRSVGRLITAAVLAAVLFTSPRHAAAEPQINGTPSAAYLANGSSQPLFKSVELDSDMGIYSAGYFDIELPEGTAFDQLTLASNGDLRVDGSNLFWKNTLFGVIDSLRNGRNGQPLRVHFAIPLENASFESGLEGWTVDSDANQMNGEFWADGNFDQPDSDPMFDDGIIEPTEEISASISSDLAMNYAIDQLALQGNNDPSETQINQYIIDNEAAVEAYIAANFTAYFEEDYKVFCTATVVDESDEDLDEPPPAGLNALKLDIYGEVDEPYGTSHCPSILSTSFQARAGDIAVVDYYALDSGDFYSIFGFIINPATSATQLIIREVGDTTEGWGKVRGTIETEVCPSGLCNLQFKFLAGSYDESGGEAIGSILFIDNVGLTKEVTIPMANAVLRSVQYSSSNPDFNSLTECVTYTGLLTADDSTGAVTSEFPLEICPAPQNCEQLPDMAVNPQFINLAPGQKAVVEVSFRNLCNDVPQGPNDLLVSFSDGLTVSGGTNGMLNLGQRAAWERWSLNPGETRTFFVEVTAGETFVAAPVHISELYNGGRVAKRIDGVFITPTPVPAAVAPVVAPAEPAPVPTAQPLPSTLPNTSNGSELPLMTMLVLALFATGLGLSRRLMR